MHSNTMEIPNNIEAEKAILGKIIENPEELVKVVSILSPSTFYLSSHQEIYQVIFNIFNSKGKIDEITIGEALKSVGKLDNIGGYVYLAELSSNAPVSGNIKYWAEIIKEDFVLRELISLSSIISKKARDPKQGVTKLLIESETKIRELAAIKSTDMRLLGDVVTDCYKEIEHLSTVDNEKIGIRLGLEDIDNLIGGLMPGDFMVIGARPGMGKSALVLNMIVNVALAYNEPCLLFSREMQKTKLAKRALSSHGLINQFFLKTGKTKRQDDWDNLLKSTTELQNAKVYLDDKTKQIDEMIYKSHSLNAQCENGLKLICFDYLQKIIGAGQKVREQEISDISAKMKDLAMDLNVPVIALAQLNRGLETRGNKRPQLSDLRESGAIEQDADIIGFLYRDDYYNRDNSKKQGIAEIDFVKVRDGSVGLVELYFDGKYTRFSTIPKYGIT